MNYWVTLLGRVYKSDYEGFHADLAIDHFEQLKEDEQNKVMEWLSENEGKTMVHYLEEVCGWVRYIGDVVGGVWVLTTNELPSPEQIEQMKKLTGFKF